MRKNEKEVRVRIEVRDNPLLPASQWIMGLLFVGLALLAVTAKASAPGRCGQNTAVSGCTDTVAHTLSQHGLLEKMYIEGVQAVIEGDFDQGYNVISTLARIGHTDSQYYLGTMYFNGYGTGQSADSAVHWYQQAAISGHTQAQYNMGVAYAKGIGVKQDLNEAIAWWQRAALKGNIDAQFNLGMVYSRGFGVAQDLTTAAVWWRKAALSGDPAAQFNLGLMHANGEGVGQDIDQAIKWLRASANQGYKEAIILLKDLQQANFDMRTLLQ